MARRIPWRGALPSQWRMSPLLETVVSLRLCVSMRSRVFLHALLSHTYIGLGNIFRLTDPREFIAQLR